MTLVLLLPTPRETKPIHDIFSHRFNTLIKKINNQLILRLHQERNPLFRPLIKDFPLQLEHVKENLFHFLKILNMPTLPLHGIYLTSAIQLPKEHHNDQRLVIPHLSSTSLQLLRSPIQESKTFFVKQMLLQGLLSTADLPAKPILSSPWKKRLAYAASLFAVLLSVLMLGQDFQKSLFQTYAMQSHLMQYHQILYSKPEDIHLTEAIPLLNALEQNAIFASNQLSHFHNPFIFYSKKSKQQALLTYQKALDAVVITEVKRALYKALKQTLQESPEQQYALLKAYLLFGQYQKEAIPYLVKTLQRILKSELKNENWADLSRHFHHAFHPGQRTIPLDQNLIREVRFRLKNLPTETLAHIILKNAQDFSKTDTLNRNNLINTLSVFSVGNLFKEVSPFYTREAFEITIQKDIPEAALEATKGNAVLGSFQTLSHEQNIKQLIQIMHQRYIQQYIKTWEDVLDKLVLHEPKSLLETDALIVGLMSQTSPLLQLLKTIQEQTSLTPILTSSMKLNAVNDLLKNASSSEEENTLYQTFIKLKQLHFFLQPILTSKEYPQTVFETTKMRMQNPGGDPISDLHIVASQSPEPIRGWLNNIANWTWSNLLSETSQFIENAWQVNIGALYHKQLGQQEADNMDLPLLSELISKEGALVHFYDYYLKPFVNDNTKLWSFRLVDKQKLFFSTDALLQIQQALKLQNLSKYALFTQGRQNPALKNLQLPEKLLEEI